MKSPAPTPPPLLLPADDDVPVIPAAPWPDLTPLASAQARRAWVRDRRGDQQQERSELVG